MKSNSVLRHPALFSFLAIAGCAGGTAATKTSAEEPSSSFANAVVFEVARTESEGMAAEHLWLPKNMPDWHWEAQRLVDRGGRVYDVIDLRKDGASKAVHFDITDWFGNLN